MRLYRAMRAILRDGGPCDNLFLFELPSEQCDALDVAFIPLSGLPPTRALGKQDVTGGPDGVQHDGGILWHHTGVQFQIRGRDRDNPEPVADLGDDIRDLLAQFAGPDPFADGRGDVYADERIFRVELSVPPNFYGQDELGRPIVALTVEVWHKPERMAA